ncbi:MAG: ABC transporter ATP-binding protein [Anaerolineae bacterium]
MHHTIEVEGVSFSYPNGYEALRDITFSIGPNEKVALIGPNGAGKSTLMLHLNGLLRCQHGTIRVGGLPISDENLGQIRAWVGLVFQNADDQLFSPRVFDDVAFGPLHMGLPADEVRQRSIEALEAVGMAAYADHISHQLSIGQKKRVAIATVLSMGPKILVMDEPTAGLDPRARRSLINLLSEMERTMLIATHDVFMVRELFPRTIVMDEGHIVANGPTSDILADEGLLVAHGLELF